MSNRVMKKVLGNDDLKVSPESEDEEPVAFSNSKHKGGGRVRNPYELLNELSESEAKEDDGIADDNDTNKSCDSSKVDDETSQATSKKKKRRKKPKKAAVTVTGSGSDKAGDTEVEDEQTLRQRQKFKPPAAASRKEKDTFKISPVYSKALAEYEGMFKIDSRYLSSDFELKKIFGARVINYERSKHGQRRVYRQTKLVMPKEQWPSSTGSGLSMEYLETRDGFLFFKFTHNPQYQHAQLQFMKAVDTLNPDNIVTILRTYSYHIDARIQLSDMAKAGEDMQVAADLIEGALYAMESAFHVRFSVTNPLCRLDYKFQENRAFYILLFKHLTFVGQRACHRTALELCKRLLSLDPTSDPLCVTLMIDFYALKAGELEWFTSLYHFWEKSKNLDQLPNFAYSVALAYHNLSVGGGVGKPLETAELAKAEKLADQFIQYAILMFPAVLLPLLDKVGVQIDSTAKNHSYFNAPAQQRSLKLLCELYVLRTHHVWREPTVLGWLEKNVHAVLKQVDGKDPKVHDFEGKRKRRYQATTPRNILRHVLLTDVKELSLHLPPELSKEAILNYDPLPPPDAVDIYKVKEYRSGSGNSTRRAGILQMLLSSLVNDLNAPNADRNLQAELADAAAAVAGNQDGGDGPALNLGVAAGFQQSVNALLDAMRELLSNANNRPEGEAEAADGEESASDG